MYVNPIAYGVFCTLFVEAIIVIAIIIVAGINEGKKKKR